MEALLAGLLLLLAIGAVGVLAVVLAVVLGARALDRRNRVSATAPTPAPTSWLGAPTSAARLHRRLRNAVAVARAASTAAGANPQLAEIADTLEAEAVALDGHIVVTARMPAKARRGHQRALADQVNRIERLASQVSVQSAQAQAPRTTAVGDGSALDELALQLDALEAAREEVAEVEAEAGLHRVSPYAAPGSPIPRRAPGAPSDSADAAEGPTRRPQPGT